MSTLTVATSNNLRKRAIEVTEQNTKSVLDLAEVLWETYTHDVKVGGNVIALWAAWDYSDWFQYVEVELGIHQTTAAIYRRMHEVYNIYLKDSFDPGVLSGISATKLKILTRVVNRKNVNAWLRKAAKLSCCGLEEEVDDAVHGTGRPGAIHTLAVLCTKAEQKKMRGILNKAMIDLGADRPGKALIQILEEWSAIHARSKRAQAAAG